ncbi:hypothetical protein FK513_32760, partial [Klebsiella pneumoniae]|uniref:hydroxyethylthiazole kinase n=1 Tax=Klebsiella pneumoniae TaxID=573 RepID=UPI002108D106
MYGNAGINALLSGFIQCAHSPLVHCMTNDVVQTFTANVLLAVAPNILSRRLKELVDDG